MIGRLTGILLEKQPPHLLLDVNGVGYELDAPMSTFYQLPSMGEKLSLYTHLVVREECRVACRPSTTTAASSITAVSAVSNGCGSA